MKDIAFGQYYPVNSVVHRMDPRAKILLLILYIVMTFMVKSFWGFLLTGLFLFAIILISRVPLGSVLKSVRGIMFIIVFTALINVFLHRDTAETVIWEWWKLRITDKSIEFAVFMVLRLLFLVTGSSVLTLTTDPVSLTDGIESLLKPLTIIKFPTHELALTMSITLRFIPTLMEETNRIISAQKARGAEFESGNLIKKAKALIPVLIPLLISAIRRADELGSAMDARCYSEAKHRTKYKKLQLNLRDYIGFIVGALMITGVVLINTFTVTVI